MTDYWRRRYGAEVHAILSVVATHPEATLGQLASVPECRDIKLADLIAASREAKNVRLSNRPPIRSARPPTTGTDALCGRVARLLQRGPMKSHDVAVALGVHVLDARRALADLRRAGAADHTGAGRGLTWHVIPGRATFG